MGECFIVKTRATISWYCKREVRMSVNLSFLFELSLPAFSES